MKQSYIVVLVLYTLGASVYSDTVKERDDAVSNNVITIVTNLVDTGYVRTNETRTINFYGTNYLYWSDSTNYVTQWATAGYVFWGYMSNGTWYVKTNSIP